MGYYSSGLMCDQPSLATATPLLFERNRLLHGGGPLTGLEHNGIALFGNASSAWRDIYHAVSVYGAWGASQASCWLAGH